MRALRSIPVLALLAVTSACSPYDYSKAASALDTGAKALDDSVISGRQQMAGDVVATYRRSLIANRSPVTIARSCDEPLRVRLEVPREDDPPEKEDKAVAPPAPRQPCDVYLEKDRGRPFDDPFPVPPALASAMKELTEYTGALVAVTNSKDRADYDAAVTSLATAAGKIISTAGGAGAVAGPAVTAGVNRLGWMVGTALDIQRYEPLKGAVNPPVWSPTSRRSCDMAPRSSEG
jgi:hypothetical protein